MSEPDPDLVAIVLTEIDSIAWAGRSEDRGQLLIEQARPGGRRVAAWLRDGRGLRHVPIREGDRLRRGGVWAARFAIALERGQCKIEEHLWGWGCCATHLFRVSRSGEAWELAVIPPPADPPEWLYDQTLSKLVERANRAPTLQELSAVEKRPAGVRCWLRGEAGWHPVDSMRQLPRLDELGYAQWFAIEPQGPYWRVHLWDCLHRFSRGGCGSRYLVQGGRWFEEGSWIS